MADPKMRALVDYLRRGYRSAAAPPVTTPPTPPALSVALTPEAYRVDRFVRAAPSSLREPNVTLQRQLALVAALRGSPARGEEIPQ